MPDTEYKELFEQQKQFYMNGRLEMVKSVIDQLSLKYDCDFIAINCCNSLDRDTCDVILHPEYDEDVCFTAEIKESTSDIYDRFISTLEGHRIGNQFDKELVDNGIASKTRVLFTGDDSSLEEDVDLTPEEYIEKFSVNSLFLVTVIDKSRLDKNFGNILLEACIELSKKYKLDIVIKLYVFADGFEQCEKSLRTVPNPGDAWYKSFNPETSFGFAVINGEPSLSAENISEKCNL